MQKILTAAQMHQVDNATIETLKISSFSLMEQASMAFVEIFQLSVPNKEEAILIVCGTGNNGGDGLAIARLLAKKGYSRISVLIYHASNEKTADFVRNLDLLKSTTVAIRHWEEEELPLIEEDIIIDALIGIGLNRPIKGRLKNLIEYINYLNKQVIAVDIPTGMPSEGNIDTESAILRAEKVISFQRPKLNFLFPESSKCFDHFIIVDIGLDEDFIDGLPSPYYLLEASDITTIYRKRQPFTHKGSYGSALIIAGEKGTVGAALLASEACLYAGAGLTTVCIPKDSEMSLNIRQPELMFLDEDELESRCHKYNAIAIGPGLGERSQLLKKVLSLHNEPMLLDADALNFLTQNKAYLERLPPQSILTPHMKEFDRLFGDSDSWYERLQLAREKAKEHKLIIVLKNHYTFICLPDLQVYINSTGNPGMASGGMGDVLSGIITAFLAQGYCSKEATILGCYLHGLAGDRLKEEGMEIITASRLAEKIPFIIGELQK